MKKASGSGFSAKRQNHEISYSDGVDESDNVVTDGYGAVGQDQSFSF